MDRFTAMETFVSVLETGSFSNGARRMHVGQPAVSKSITQLESKLGVRLFVRSPRGLTPIEAAQRFCDRAKAAIDAAEDAEVQARGTDASLTDTLRVCAPRYVRAAPYRACTDDLPSATLRDALRSRADRSRD